MLDRRAQLGIAIAAVGGFKILMIAVEDFWVISGFQLLNSIVGLHHALFCPVYSGRCLSKYFLALGVLMSYSSEGPNVVETDFVFYGVWMAHYMAEEFHTLLRETLCGEGALILSSMHFLMHPCVRAFLC